MRDKEFNVDKKNRLNLSNLGITNITEIKGLTNLTDLQELDLSFNKLTRIEGLSGLSQLKSLNLAGNQIIRIEGLDYLNGLKDLNLHHNQIRWIEGLASLINLREINLFGNPIEWPDSLSNRSKPSALINYCAVYKIDEGTRLQRELERLRLEKENRPQLIAKEEVKTEEVHLQSNVIESERIARLKKLVQVSRRLKRVEIGEYLGLKGKELFDRLVDWAAEFGFTLDGEDVDFQGGRVDDFVAELGREFEKWNQTGVSSKKN